MNNNKKSELEKLLINEDNTLTKEGKIIIIFMLLSLIIHYPILIIKGIKK